MARVAGATDCGAWEFHRPLLDCRGTLPDAGVSDAAGFGLVPYCVKRNRVPKSVIPGIEV
jgi:hypothetical protein